ncbi:glycosyltransferase [Agrococcus jenensis]|uniref:Cellulose synthase/poly-beta-1,6-N-acetylglucosamine synthase-like glycosyltransferase n=1 Tax=Agrococcus jenensis TaxID=46353 RepID=A0A3N2APF9_9MICO|nr:glycosyltransferase [Agrococcus jenensis]ROR64941.1 cellulose synthase/poly-beta-1,6-N-acetylglucosamine synthase-like glycosyltransferase [Agrococcus jenensis]
MSVVQHPVHQPPTVQGPGPVAPPPARADAATEPLPWWLPVVPLALVLTGMLVLAGLGVVEAAPTGTATWWLQVLLGHVPFLVILAYLAAGLAERIGYLRHGRAAARPGRLPMRLPKVAVQLPMFEEPAVASRAIEAAAALRWPADRLVIQVLDDSVDPVTRRVVDRAAARARDRGVDCRVLRRADRAGYKAGALEAARRQTDAELLVILDADFVPAPGFLLEAVAHLHDEQGRPLPDLALVQARWGHLNADDSWLTRAQSLWVDDHHIVQKSFRSARWRFVNFTGTAGVWRADAIESAGGWRAASLVEDCELSFRHLFLGWRTTAVKEIVVPSELPATVTAYKAQQKRWTSGWVQLQRLHLGTLLGSLRERPARRLQLAYHMTIAWQWPLWALWVCTLPFLISTGLWAGALGAGAGIAAYLAPTLAWLLLSTALASVEGMRLDDPRPTARGLLRRLARVVPYVVLNAGMLPHQLMAFVEGLHGPMHTEFERTPKAGAGVATQRVRIHWPAVLAEVGFVVLQLGWAVVLLAAGLTWCALGAALLALAVAWLGWFYGDDAGRRALVLGR